MPKRRPLTNSKHLTPYGTSTDTPTFSVNWFPGHMKKTTDLIKHIAQSVNVVIEVLDARIPLSSRNPLIVSTTENLPRLIILSKSDLAHPSITDAWLSYFRKKHYGVIATDLTENKTHKTVVNKITKMLKEILLPTQAHHSPQSNRNKKNFIPQLYLALICGIPNAGKSTLINVLAKEKKVKVGNRPGITMDKQIIRVAGDDRNFSWALVDTPGLLKHKLNNTESVNLSVCKVVKETIYDPVDLTLAFLSQYVFDTGSRTQPFLHKNIFSFYGLNPNAFAKIPESIQHQEDLFLKMLAQKRNLFEKNGEPNIRLAATTLLQDFQSGRLGRHSLESPPTS